MWFAFSSLSLLHVLSVVEQSLQRLYYIRAGSFVNIRFVRFTFVAFCSVATAFADRPWRLLRLFKNL